MKDSGIHDEGIADAPTIDWAMCELGGFRMGPFALMDLIGNDVNFAVTSTVFQAFYYDLVDSTPSITQQRLVEAGRSGRKTGLGFYDYREGAVQPKPTTDRALGQEIVDRILAMLINEAVEAVLWRVASPDDIDLAVTKGVNHPKGLLGLGKRVGLCARAHPYDCAAAGIRRGSIPPQRPAPPSRPSGPRVLLRSTRKERVESRSAGPGWWLISPLHAVYCVSSRVKEPDIDAPDREDGGRFVTATGEAASGGSQALANRLVAVMRMRDQFSAWLGLEVLDRAPARCTVQMTVRPEMLNGFDVCHGGVTFSARRLGVRLRLEHSTAVSDEH